MKTLAIILVLGFASLSFADDIDTTGMTQHEKNMIPATVYRMKYLDPNAVITKDSVKAKIAEQEAQNDQAIADEAAKQKKLEDFLNDIKNK